MLSTHLGELRGAVGGTLPVDHLLATMPPVVFDAVAVAGGAVSIAALKAPADAVHFVREASKHAAPAEGADRLRQAGIVSGPDDASSSGLSIGADPAARANAFLNVIPMPRHWERSSTDAMAA